MQVHLATPWCQSCRLPRNVRRPGYVGDMRSEAEVHCAPPCDFFGIRLGMHPNGAVRQSHWVTATAACRVYGSMTAGMECAQLFPEMRRGNDKSMCSNWLTTLNAYGGTNRLLLDA